MIEPPRKGTYEALPEAIRQYYTRREWEWLTDAQKAGLERAELEPEYDE
jgi:predicted transcriptional regulator